MDDLSKWVLADNNQPKSSDQDLSEWVLAENNANNSEKSNNLSNIPEIALDAIVNFPEAMWSILKQSPDAIIKMREHPIKSLQDLLGGIARGSQNLASSGLEAGEYLTRKGAEGLLKATGYKNAEIPYFNSREFMGLEGDRPINLGAMIESKNPNPLLSALGQYGLGGAAGGTKLLPMMLANSMTGITQAAPGERTEAAVKGAVNTGLPTGLIKVLKNSPNLLPSNFISKFVGSNLSKEELLRNLEVTKGTSTGLGDVIESPRLKGLQENILSKVPFSGVQKALHQTSDEILNRGNNIVNQYLGNINPLEVSEKLGESLIKGKNTQNQIKNKLYEIPNNIADESGFKLELPNFTKNAKDHISSLENTNIIKMMPEIKNLLSKLNIIKSPNMEEISPILNEKGLPFKKEKPISLKEANILAGQLREAANRLGQSIDIGERYASKVIGGLSSTLKKDIKNEIKSSGNKKLIESFDNAEKNYSENYSSFLDKDINKFTMSGPNAKSADDLVSNFLKTSNVSDKADQLEKLLKVIPKKDHDLIKYSYFSRALQGPEDMQFVNPNKLSTLWNKLGDKQKRLLIPDKNERRNLDNYSLLVKKNPKAVNLMFNPATGHANLDIITALILSHPITGLKEIAGARLLGKKLSNEKFREKVVNKIIKQKESK